MRDKIFVPDYRESINFKQEAGEIIEALDGLFKQHAVAIGRLVEVVSVQETEAGTRGRFLQFLAVVLTTKDFETEMGNIGKGHLAKPERPKYDFTGLLMPEVRQSILAMVTYYVNLGKSIPIDLETVEKGPPENFEGSNRLEIEKLALARARLEVKLLENFLTVIEKYFNGEELEQ